MAEKLLEVCAEPVEVSGQKLVMGCSIGIALPSIGSTPVTLIHRADQAMYAEKNRYYQQKNNDRRQPSGA